MVHIQNTSLTHVLMSRTSPSFRFLKHLWALTLLVWNIFQPPSHLLTRTGDHREMGIWWTNHRELMGIWWVYFFISPLFGQWNLHYSLTQFLTGSLYLTFSAAFLFQCNISCALTSRSRGCLCGAVSGAVFGAMGDDIMEQAMVVVFPEDDPRVCQVSFRRNVPLLILQTASIEAGQMRFGERKLGEDRRGLERIWDVGAPQNPWLSIELGQPWMATN